MMKAAIKILKSRLNSMVPVHAELRASSLTSELRAGFISDSMLSEIEREINEINDAISLLSGEGSKRLAAYVVDFDEPTGISIALETAIADCHSSEAAEKVLANLFNEVLAGKIW